MLFPRLSDQRQQSVLGLRTDLKQEIKDAWAQASAASCCMPG